MSLLNREKMRHSLALARSEWRVLVPLFVVFDVVLVFLPALLLLLSASKVSTPHAQANPSAGVLSLVMIVFLPIAVIVLVIVKMAALRARSLHIPLDAGYFAHSMQHAFGPVLHVCWSMFWRALLVTIPLSIAAGILSGILSGASGHPAAPAAAWTLLAFSPWIPMMTFALFVPLMVYLLPFTFACYFRQFHPEKPHKVALAFGSTSVAGRRGEILCTLLALGSLLLVAAIVNHLLARLAPPTTMFGTATALLGVIINTLFGLPTLIATYLYYEEFETAAGLTPGMQATPLTPS